jgi:hypothetical protein
MASVAAGFALPSRKFLSADAQWLCEGVLPLLRGLLLADANRRMRKTFLNRWLVRRLESTGGRIPWLRRHAQGHALRPTDRNKIGSIKQLIIDKVNGRVSYAVLSVAF